MSNYEYAWDYIDKCPFCYETPFGYVVDGEGTPAVAVDCCETLKAFTSENNRFPSVAEAIRIRGEPMTGMTTGEALEIVYVLALGWVPLLTNEETHAMSMVHDFIANHFSKDLEETDDED